MKKNEVQLSFCIWGFTDITHDKLTEIFGVSASKIHVRGERINPNFPRLAKENGWILDSPCVSFAPFEAQIDSLLDIIETKKELLKPICNKYYCEFSCAVFVRTDEESTPSVHLSARYHELAKELMFEFDLDLYCLQNA